jgi:hypothetical protein
MLKCTPTQSLSPETEMRAMHRLQQNAAIRQPHPHVRRREHRNDRDHRLGLTPPHTTEHATRREHRNDRDHRLGLTPAPHTTGQRITREEHRNDRHHRLGLTPTQHRSTACGAGS